MANTAYAAIRKRLREIVDDGDGLVRVVSSGKFSGDYWTGITAWAGHTRALSKPRFAVPAMITALADGTPIFTNASHKIERVDMRIECEYALPIPTSSDDDRDAQVATAEQDGDIIAQAVGWPGNMTQTEAAAPTGILDGSIRHTLSRPVIEDWDARRLVMEHTFRAFVNVVQATS